MRFDVRTIASLLVFAVASSASASDCTLFPGRSWSSGNSPRGVASGDLNGDGKPDLAVANFGGSTNGYSGSAVGDVSIFLGDGMGGLSLPTHFAAGSNPVSIAIGDLNNDGMADLAVADFGAHPAAGGVSILIGNGLGSFFPHAQFVAGAHPTYVAIDDLNSDGNLDIAVANFTSNGVSVLLGNGLGGFSTPMNYGVGTQAIEMHIH